MIQTGTSRQRILQKLSLRHQMTGLVWASLLLFTFALSMPLWQIYQEQKSERINGIQNVYVSRWNGMLDGLGGRLENRTPTAEERAIAHSLNAETVKELLQHTSQATGLLKISYPPNTSTVWLASLSNNTRGQSNINIAPLETYTRLIRDQLGVDFFAVDTQGELLATNNQVQWQAFRSRMQTSSSLAPSSTALLAEDWIQIPLKGLGGTTIAHLHVHHTKGTQEQLVTSLWLITAALMMTLIALLGSLGQGLIQRLFAPMDQLNNDLSSLAQGDWFLDLERPIQDNEISRMQQALLVFQQQTVRLAQQSFEHKLTLLRERHLLEVELQRIAQLLPAQEQEALRKLLISQPHNNPESTSSKSPLAQGFQMVSAKVIDQQTRVNELLAQRTADLTLIQQALLERTQLDRLREELTLATKLQMANLPQAEAAEALRPTLDLFATMRSAREVGGDFYDFFQLNEDHVVMMVGDASGKGIAAGMLVLVARTLLRAHLMAGRNVAQCLTDCNRLLTHDNPGGSFTTVFLSLLNLRTGQLIYSNAGHNPPLLRKASGNTESLTQANGVMLGITDEWDYITHQIQLSAGDCLLLYSDGVSEAHNAAHELFGQVRLAQCFSQKGVHAQADVMQLLQRVDDFASEVDQFDDITILVMRYRPEASIE